jgi:nuclear transport factor 2 (NTF2) superfamily protein
MYKLPLANNEIEGVSCLCIIQEIYEFHPNQFAVRLYLTWLDDFPRWRYGRTC